MITNDELILQNLNPVQREAVLAGDGPLLILAGAGSGKTRVLTRRIAHLILARDVPPERILAVTFTNKAAGEMRERVERLLDIDAAALWIGTFHSICLRLLRRHGERLGFSGAITVFDQDDQKTLFKNVLKSLGRDDEAPKVREIQSAVSMAKNKLWDPDDLAAKWRHPDRSRIAELYREYQARLRAQNGVDFDDLLVLAVRLLETYEDLGDSYARKFLHILVDEYQDTNHVQYRLIRRLARAHGNVTVVGDDDQSIYGWRGADISNILEFERSYPQAKTMRMTQNYRSTGSILEVANAVVKKNKGRLDKSLWTENDAGRPVRLLVRYDEESEARKVIGSIREQVWKGDLRNGQTTILYRIHAQSRPFEEACLTQSVPYVIVGGIAFYQRKEVKDLLAYLRLGVNPRDLVSFRRAIASPRRGVGEVSLGRIEESAMARGGDLVAACADLTAGGGVRGQTYKRVVEFGHLLQELAGHAAEGPEPLLRRVLEGTDYLDWIKETEKTSWEDRQANVLELLEGAERFQKAIGPESLEAYLDQVALYTNLDRGNLDEDRVQMMTVHNAKGLEFSTVFITGLEEGLFPHASALDDAKEMEEERRLFYVATTRAMKDLTLTASLQRRRFNRFSDGGLSRFLGEIPEELLEIESEDGSSLAELLEFSSTWRTPAYSHMRNGTRERGPELRRTSRTVVDAPGPGDLGPADTEPVIQRGSGETEPSLKGRQVRHAVFGIGRVDEQEGNGPEARLAIYFPGAGRRKILARYVQPLS